MIPLHTQNVSFVTLSAERMLNGNYSEVQRRKIKHAQREMRSILINSFMIYIQTTS